MSSASNASNSTASNGATTQKRSFIFSFLHLPRNVYLLLFFTTGKGFQLTISTLTLNYYVHSLGYHPDFIGLFSAMPAIGVLIAAVPSGWLADHIGRKPVLLMTAILTPLFLMAIGLVSSAPLLLGLGLVQGLVSTAYWVTNLPLLVENTTEAQRVGVLALNSFLLLGVGALGNLLGGAIPEFAAGILHSSASSSGPLSWSIIVAGLFTLIFGLPLWFLQEPKKGFADETVQSVTADAKNIADTEQSKAEVEARRAKSTVMLFGQLLLPDLLFTMGEGAVVALIQLYFVLRFSLLPGELGVIFTISGLLGGIFSLTAPLFTRRWSKLRLITTVQYLTAPLMVLIGFAPVLSLAVAGEYTRSFMRTLIEPVYAAFAMEQVSDRQRGMLAGLYSVSWSVGFSIGPAVAGWLQSNISLSASFVFGGLCLLVAPCILLTFFGRKPGRTIAH